MYLYSDKRSYTEFIADKDEILKQIRKAVVSSLDTVLNPIPIVKVWKCIGIIATILWLWNWLGGFCDYQWYAVISNSWENIETFSKKSF